MMSLDLAHDGGGHDSARDLSMAGSAIPELQCALEPIHAPGTIQPHGRLLVLTAAAEPILVAASAKPRP